MMPMLVRLLTEASVDKYIPKKDHIVLFVQELEGTPVLCCKRSDGSVYKFTGSEIVEQPTVDTASEELLIAAETTGNDTVILNGSYSAESGIITLE